MRRALTATIACLGLLPVLPAVAAPVPAGATWHEEYFTNPADGTTLHADVFRPKGLADSAKTPVLLVVSPYLNESAPAGTDFDPSASGPSNRFYDFLEAAKLFEHGYSYVQVDLRGTGGSAGCNDWGGPGEQSDVKAAVEWAGTQKWSSGRVGMYGKSYDGWTGVMALAQRPQHLAAVITQEPVIDGYRYLFMNGVPYLGNWLGTVTTFQALDAQPGSTSSSMAYQQNAISSAATNPACYAMNTIGAAGSDPASAYWKPRNLIPLVKGARTPTLVFYGFEDDNTKPDHVFDVFNGLRGPKWEWLGQWNHVRGNESDAVGRKGFVEQAVRFLDRFVKDAGPDAPVEQDPLVTLQQGDGRWRSESQWPPDDSARLAIPLRDGSYADTTTRLPAPFPSPATLWTFSQPLPYDVHLAGVPMLSAQVTTTAPVATLVALLYDVAPDGKATLFSRGAYKLTGSGPVDFELYAQDWPLAAGHRVAVQLAGDDGNYFVPTNTGTTVGVASAKLALPFLAYRRDTFLKGGVANAMGLRTVIDVAPDRIAAATKTFPLPPALVPLPGPASIGPLPQLPGERISVHLRRSARRRLVVFGVAPAGLRHVGVRLLRGKRALAVHVVPVQRTRYRTVFRVRRGGVYRAAVGGDHGSHGVSPLLHIH